MLKGSSKQKRKRAEIEEVKDEEMMLKADRQTYLENVKKLKRDRD